MNCVWCDILEVVLFKFIPHSLEEVGELRMQENSSPLLSIRSPRLGYAFLFSPKWCNSYILKVLFLEFVNKTNRLRQFNGLTVL